ncbi:hypothetical protein MLD38_018206 [Melastoma candidum]|uniref:Uncharacterized protein n=1 Tax=Melastoma candidum TaxID=119954 RepID=A0ACB9R1C6_9MYRT|nr:hypothetical protein MLD38_018206 [Melastoma candidum]
MKRNEVGRSSAIKEDGYETNKSEIEKKAARIMELLKGGDHVQDETRGGKDSGRVPEVNGLVEDFIKQYQSLRVLYDQLKQDASSSASASASTSTPSRSEVPKIRKYDSATSFFSSDSDYFSPEELDPENLGGPETPTANSAPDNASILKNELNFIKKEKEALSSQYSGALAASRELESVVTNLKAELRGMKSEADGLRRDKCKLEVRVQEQEAEIKAVNKKNSELQARIQKLKSAWSSKEEEITNYRKKIEDEMNHNATEAEMKLKQRDSVIAEFVSRVREKDRLIDEKINKIKVLEEELREKVEDENRRKNLEIDENNKVAEAEMKLKHRESEITELASWIQEKDTLMEESLNRIKDLEEELQRKMEDETARKNLENNETDAEAKLKHQESEIDELVSQIQEKDGLIEESLNRIRSLEEDLGKKIEERKRAIIEIDRLSVHIKDAESKNDEALHQRENEANLFRREKAELEAKISEIERKSREMSDEIFERSLHATEITARADSLQKRVDSLLALNRELESQKQKSDEESCQLAITVADLRSKLNDQAGTIVKLSSKYTLAKNSLQQAKSEFRGVEKRMEGMTEEFRKSIDDSIRILYQRIRVIEQLHGENKDCYRAMKDGFRRDNKGLEEVMAKHETEMRRLRDVALSANEESWRLDTAVRGIDDALGRISGRISRMSGEVRGMMSSRAAARATMVRATGGGGGGREEEEEEGMLTSMYLRGVGGKEEQGGESRRLRRVVWRLEKKVVHLEGLAREREEVLLGLAAEKREAIKQLCMLIDYHRSRSDHFRDIISRMAIYRMVGS